MSLSRATSSSGRGRRGTGDRDRCRRSLVAGERWRDSRERWCCAASTDHRSSLSSTSIRDRFVGRFAGGRDIIGEYFLVFSRLRDDLGGGGGIRTADPTVATGSAFDAAHTALRTLSYERFGTRSSNPTANQALAGIRLPMSRSRAFPSVSVRPRPMSRELDLPKEGCFLEFSLCDCSCKIVNRCLWALRVLGTHIPG
jgi:hypothetical protein